MSQPSASIPSTTTSSTARKPRISLAISTAFGLGYLPKAPGTWGSLAGIALAMIPFWFTSLISWAGPGPVANYSLGTHSVNTFIFFQCLLAIVVALIGVWTADRAAKYWNTKDPQRVVIDEVSGQQLTLLFGGFWPLHVSTTSIESYGKPILWSTHPLGMSMAILPNWKYLLLGFILFRVFDIWKPFPARQAESLPGGLGIMADDWIAGIYAALGLWIARAVGI